MQGPMGGAEPAQGTVNRGMAQPRLRRRPAGLWRSYAIPASPGYSSGMPLSRTAVFHTSTCSLV